MYNIVSTLKSSNIIETVEIIDLIDEDNISLLKLKVTLMDESLLYIHELHTQNYQKYSYHWQKESGETIMRWDDSPHHKNLANFPYHLHDGTEIRPSYRVNIEDVLQEIQSRYDQQ